MDTEDMLENIMGYGFANRDVLRAMQELPRRMFIPEKYRDMAYHDSALPTYCGQTISQPYTVAFMLDALMLRQGHNVLEIGGGSGFGACLIKKLVGSGRVVSVESIGKLCEFARKNAKKAGVEVEFVHGDGSEGCEKYAPYDRIVVTCAAPKVPSPLISQLAKGGIMLIPVGRGIQEMIRLQKTDTLKKESLGSFAFVELKGKHGFGSKSQGQCWP